MKRVSGRDVIIVLLLRLVAGCVPPSPGRTWAAIPGAGYEVAPISVTLRPTLVRQQQAARGRANRPLRTMESGDAASACGAATLPASVPHELAAAALVLAVVGAQPLAISPVVRALARVVHVTVGGAPAPEVAAAAGAAPAVTPVGAGRAAPEGAQRLQALARRAALGAPRRPRGSTGPSFGGRLRHRPVRERSTHRASVICIVTTANLLGCGTLRP